MVSNLKTMLLTLIMTGRALRRLTITLIIIIIIIIIIIHQLGDKMIYY